MLSRYSHSSLETFRQCPKKFWFRYVDRVKLPRRVFAHLQLGTIVHRRLAAIYRQALDGSVCSRAELIASYENDWNQLDKTRLEVSSEHMAVDDYIESGRRMLGAYYDKYVPFDQGLLIMAEGDVSFRLPGTDARFIARIDRVLRKPDGVTEICDYKTGGRALPSANDAAFRLQMGLYQLAIQDRYPQYEEIELAQYALKYEEAVSYRLRPDELDELTEQFRSEVHQIAHAQRLDDWPAQESGLCNFCDYAHLCPKKRHKITLETEDDPEKKTSAEQAAALADQYLHWNDEKKAADAELKALRGELLAAAKDLGVSKLYGSEGHVLVSIKNAEKLPTKTADPGGLVEVTALVRSWGEEMETCFKLDDRVLMEVIRKGRLSPERFEQLKKFLRVHEGAVVRAFPKTVNTEED